MPDNIQEINDKGQFHGWNIVHFNNGNIMYKGQFINDSEHGLWEYFNLNGTIMHKGEYINGNQIGFWIEEIDCKHNYFFYAR